VHLLRRWLQGQEQAKDGARVRQLRTRLASQHGQPPGLLLLQLQACHIEEVGHLLKRHRSKAARLPVLRS
jgi:hypothetical protein